MPDVRISAGIDSSSVKTGLAEIRAYAKETFASFDSIGKSFAGGFLGGVGIGSIVSFAKGVFDLAGHIEDLSERFGVGTKFIQQWAGAGEEAGVSMDDVAQALNKQTIAISRANNGNEQLVRDFQALGVSVGDLKNLTPEQIWEKISHSSMNAASMVEIFGRNALSLIPVMKSVADGTVPLGEAIDDNVIKKLDSAGDAWTRAEKRGEVRGGNLLGYLVQIGEKFKNISPFAIGIDKLLGTGDAPAGSQKVRSFQRDDPEEARAREQETVREESLRDRLAKLDEDRAARQRTNQEQLNFLLAQRRSIMETVLQGGATEEESLKAGVALAENRNAVDAVNSKISKDQAETEKKITAEREKAAEQAEREAEARAKAAAQARQELADSLENSAELREQLAGHEDIAKQLKISYDFNLRINEARAAGNKDLASQLETEKQLTLEIAKQEAAAKRREEEAKRIAQASVIAGRTTEAVRSGQTSIDLSALPKTQALLAAGVSGTLLGAAQAEARNPLTGVVTDDALATALSRLSASTRNGFRNLSSVEQTRVDQLNQQFAASQSALAAQNSIAAAAARDSRRENLTAEILRVGSGDSQLLKEILEQLRITHSVITPPPG